MSSTGIDRADCNDTVLGLDAGTTSAKAVIVDGAGRVLATAAPIPSPPTRRREAGASKTLRRSGEP